MPAARSAFSLNLTASPTSWPAPKTSRNSSATSPCTSLPSTPRFVSREDVTEADLNREKDVYRAQAAATGKPANIIEKMLEGKLAKFYEEFCLLDQPFIKESSQTIAQLIAAKVAKLGENISVRRFARFKVGAPDWTVAQAKSASEETST